VPDADARLIVRARELARGDGRPRYLVPDTDLDTGAAVVRLTADEPRDDHVRVQPDGSAVAVFLPPSAKFRW
jgi:hypothetical protein